MLIYTYLDNLWELCLPHLTTISLVKFSDHSHLSLYLDPLSPLFPFFNYKSSTFTTLLTGISLSSPSPLILQVHHDEDPTRMTMRLEKARKLQAPWEIPSLQLSYLPRKTKFQPQLLRPHVRTLVHAKKIQFLSYLASAHRDTRHGGRKCPYEDGSVEARGHLQAYPVSVDGHSPCRPLWSLVQPASKSLAPSTQRETGFETLYLSKPTAISGNAWKWLCRSFMHTVVCSALDCDDDQSGKGMVDCQKLR